MGKLHQERLPLAVRGQHAGADSGVRKGLVGHAPVRIHHADYGVFVETLIVRGVAIGALVGAGVAALRAGPCLRAVAANLVLGFLPVKVVLVGSPAAAPHVEGCLVALESIVP